jgi:acetoacetyl-CoA reductase
MDRIDHRVAIVTGGTRGIGAAIATTLARAGYHVAAGYSANQAAAQQFTGKLIADGLCLSAHQGNVGEPGDYLRVTGEVLSRHGRVDVLVNNAGITVDKTVRRMTVKDWHAVLRVNLSGASYMIQAVLEHMLDRGFGRIINISSVVGETGAFGQANYAASKSGLSGLTKSLALETARKGITVNCVAPGYTDTDMIAAIPGNVLERYVSQIPVGRLGRPEEVARVVHFLAEDDASYITGAVIPVNGGLEM